MARIASLVCLAFFACQSANAALTGGLLDDFEDGTLGGWAPPRDNTTNVAGGPAGSTRYLEIAPARRLAAFDAGINGVIDPGVTAIEVDMFRPLGASALQIRLVLFGPGSVNRWTSTASQELPGDGVWRNYSFGILPGDLTQVLGSATYADLTADLNRIMFRHDSGGPSAQGTEVGLDIGVFGIDNVSAVPIPAAMWLFAGALSALGFAARRRGA